jgi:formylglycine-generating enzyme required for sulfatase activity
LLVPGGPEARWELPPAAPFVIRTDCEAITFGLMDRPRWANAMGRDRFGLWARFELEGRDGARVGQRLRWIPPGRFWMGSPEGEWDRSGNEGPRHEVQFAEGFWLADTACAQALWTAVMGENPSRFKDAEESSRRPVERVSWDDVQTFLSRINERVDGLDLALPSEAQWEYACRAGTDTPFSFGSKIDPGMVNYDDNYPYRDARGGLYREETVPVGILPPNSWGLYEMHGNVWEWCADDWFESHDGAPKHGVVRIATNGAARGAERVLRGGSWGDPAGFCRSACRFGYHPAVRNVGIGFRCARVQG